MSNTPTVMQFLDIDSEILSRKLSIEQLQLQILQLEQMKKKVSAYSKKIMELSIQIKESTMTNKTNLEDELNKLAILNEELQKKVDVQ